jgi:hypothetical protein
MNFMNSMNGMFGKVQSGKCRLSMTGGIAVQTTGGYKTYNVKTGRLTNCSNFVFDACDDFFFVIPTNNVEIGDIIFVNKLPKCVIGINKKSIKVINYEDSTVEEILPERHVFMGNTYFYGKIVSAFGTDLLKGKGGMKNIMSYMMMSEMMKGNSGNGGGLSSVFPLMMLNGGMTNIFDGMFDFGDGDSDDEVEVDNDTDNDEVDK